MRARRAEIQVFSVSFLDVLSCALGGVLMLLLSMPTPSPVPPPPEPPPPAPTPLPPTPEPGFLLQVVMVARIDWDKPVDIDFWISDPDSRQQDKYVYYENHRSGVGYLMRDSINPDRERPWEVYFTVDPYPGVYEFYAHYYASSDEPVDVTLSLELFPGDPERRQSYREVTPTRLTKAEHGVTPGRLLGRFELKQEEGRWRLERLGP